MIGLGYHGTHTPPVVLRNVLENPAWYTAYTPYQPEISQGRLEALLNFQTMVADLTGAADRQRQPARRGHRRRRGDDAVPPPESAARRRTRSSSSTPTATRRRSRSCRPGRGRSACTVVVADLSEGLPDGDVFGVLLQYPGSSRRGPRPRVRSSRRRTTAGRAGRGRGRPARAHPARAARRVRGRRRVGTTQRFGVPLGFGGPHAGYMAVREDSSAAIPGRLVGVSVDADGAPAYRLALQTREQHIRREKATSNICTAQVLLAVIAGMYAVYHGPDGLRDIARRTHRMAALLGAALRRVRSTWFTTRSSTRSRRGCPGRRSPSPRPRSGRRSTCGWSTTDTRRHQLRRDDDARAPRSRCWRRSASPSQDLGRARRGTPDALPEGLARESAVPDPPGLPHAPQRDGDAALPAPPVRRATWRWTAR